jgi:hypothetical protein
MEGLVERRISALEQRCGPRPDPGRLAIIAPNCWSDDDRDAWERAEILHDQDLHDDLIEKYTGHRPGRRPGMVNVVIVPAQTWVEESSEDERAAWRGRVSSRHPRRA